MARNCAQREWLGRLAPGTLFRSADMPGRSRGAVRSFLSRESAKPSREAACVRIGTDMYWKPTRDDRGHAESPPVFEVIRKVAGPGFGVAGHSAGRSTGWLTHGAEPWVQMAVVGAPATTRPLPYVRLRRRSNEARRELNRLEIAYLEAIRFFDACSEVDWEEALRISASRIDHHTIIRPDLLIRVAESERCRDASLVRQRTRQLCEILAGTEAPPPARAELDAWPGRPAMLEAAHLPQLMLSGRSGRIVSMSQFVKDWGHWPDRRVTMCEREPAGPNRLDLIRIAATVHAVCERDNVPVPPWVWRYRWHEDVRMTGSRPPNERDLLNALPVCEYHRIWFGNDHIMDHRVHGPWSDVRVA